MISNKDAVQSKSKEANENIIQASFNFENHDLKIKHKMNKNLIKPKQKNSKAYYYKDKNELEIIKRFQDLIIYVYKILEKIPQNESISVDIKGALSETINYLVLAKKNKDKLDKYKYLLMVDAKFNYLNILMRISKKTKLISSKNYNVWSRKIVELDKMLEKWISFCQK